MNQFRDNIFSWIAKRQASRQVVMYPWKDIRSVVIMHEGLNVDDIAQQLKQEGKHVDIWTMPNRKDICWLTAMPKK